MRPSRALALVVALAAASGCTQALQFNFGFTGSDDGDMVKTLDQSVADLALPAAARPRGGVHDATPRKDGDLPPMEGTRRGVRSFRFASRAPGSTPGGGTDCNPRRPDDHDHDPRQPPARRAHRN